MNTAASEPPRLRLFGVPELHAGAVVAFIPERRFLLLAMLALHGGRWWPRDRAAALFWPDRPNVDARRNLRKLLFEARGVPGVQELHASDHALRWDIATDLQDFHAALAQGRVAEAVALRRGPLLDGVDLPDHPALADALAAERTRVDQLWHGAALRHLQQLPDPAERADAARQMLAVDPLDEAAVAVLVEAELAGGRRSEAAAAYQRYAERLADDFGVEPAQRLRELLQARPAAAGERVTPVPVCDRFVGRKAELAALAGQLATARVLTLLGPGGIGKSRLARQAVATPPDGGWRWIALEDLTGLGDVVACLAQRLDVLVADGDDPVEPLLRRIGPGPCRLVLDNAEHLAGLPGLLQRLLDGAPGLRLLVSSRTRLGLPDEQVLVLPGLAVPDEDSRDLDTASRFDAVRLFELCASAAQPGFRFDRHVAAVVDIVEAVDGMPLAIELAASWVRLMPPEEIARDLHGSIDLLERDPLSGVPPARPEHTSLRTVLDRSWALLAPRERAALRALSVFQGGFGRAAARQVAGCSLPLLSSLIDKSLVAVGEQGRFGLHPTVAAYAAEQLAASGDERAAVRRRHAECHAQLLARLAPHAIGDPRVLVAALATDYANARLAWQTAVAQRRSDLVADMVRALWAYFENRARQREGIELLGPALSLPAQGAAAMLAQARLRHGLSMLHHRRGDQAQALAIARSGAEFAESCGDTEAYVGCVLNAGSCLWQSGDIAGAQAQFERGVAIARERGDPQCLAWAQGNLGVVLADAGQLDAADAQLTQALAGSRVVGDHYNVGVHLINLATLARDRGDAATARQFLDAARRHCGDYDLVVLALYATNNLGHLLRDAGDRAGARRAYHEVLALAARGGAGALEWAAETGLARLDIADGDVAAARPRLCRVAAAAQARGSSSELALVALVYGDALAARGEHAAAAQAWAAAQAARTLPDVHQRGVAERLRAMPTHQCPPAPASLHEVLALLLR